MLFIVLHFILDESLDEKGPVSRLSDKDKSHTPAKGWEQETNDSLEINIILSIPLCSKVSKEIKPRKIYGYFQSLGYLVMIYLA